MILNYTSTNSYEIFFQKIEPIDFKIALNDFQAEKIKKFGEVAMY